MIAMADTTYGGPLSRQVLVLKGVDKIIGGCLHRRVPSPTRPSTALAMQGRSAGTSWAARGPAIHIPPTAGRFSLPTGTAETDRDPQIPG